MKMNLLDRTTVLAEQDFEKIGQMLEADVVTYTEVVSTMTVEELKAEETELMEEFKKDDEYLSKVTYKLPDSVDYDGSTVKRSDLANKIVSFLNRLEVDFRSTLGLYQCIRYWKQRSTEDVAYGAFDSTLRMLGTLKFKGERDCFDILVINNWFTAAHGAYSRDNMWTRYLTARHQAILKAIETLEKPDVPEATPDTAV